MAQTVPLTVRLGAANTGLALGYRILNLDRTVYSAFTVTGVVESTVLGTYSVDDGVVAPDAGGYVVWGTSGSDRLEGNIDPAASLTSIPAEVWSYATRTLTMTAQQITAAMEGDPLPIYKAATFNQTFTGLTIPSNWTKLWFTVKLLRSTLDADAAVQVLVTNPADGSGDGLIVLSGSSTTTKAHAALTVNQGAGTVAVVIKDDATALITAITSNGYGHYYDLKYKDANGDTVIITEGRATLQWAITRQI